MAPRKPGRGESDDPIVEWASTIRMYLDDGTVIPARVIGVHQSGKETSLEEFLAQQVAMTLAELEDVVVTLKVDNDALRASLKRRGPPANAAAMAVDRMRGAMAAEGLSVPAISRVIRAGLVASGLKPETAKRIKRRIKE
jgi:hypothetical protein